jgi:energy-coupling factor transporter ATP-binding protein EcfA2
MGYLMNEDIPPGSYDQTIKEIEVINSQNVTFNQTTIIQIAANEIKLRNLNTNSPYKGLNKFEENDILFFGRDQFITGLVNELTQTNLILLLGSSGSGKSSVIRAGLVPYLLREKGSNLICFTFTPDKDPFESLYVSLRTRYNKSQSEVALTATKNTFIQTVKNLKQKEDFWLILIDQFEELFFLTSCEHKRNDFIESIIYLIKEMNKVGDKSIKIIGTMRADFLGRLSPHPDFVKATEKHRPMIAEMQVDELRLAIEQPSAHHGVVFEPELVKEIIGDVQGEAGYLPLLQYTLDLLWKAEVQSGGIQSRTINRVNYRKLGGVRGSLPD